MAKLDSAFVPRTDLEVRQAWAPWGASSSERSSSTEEAFSESGLEEPRRSLLCVSFLESPGAQAPTGHVVSTPVSSRGEAGGRPAHGDTTGPAHAGCLPRLLWREAWGAPLG